MEDVAATIVECIRCQQKLRVPIRMGRLQITCPKCRAKWLMLPYKVLDITQGTRAWLDWRNQGIGASDAPAIMGENPWKSREWLLKEKVNELSCSPNDAMLRGAALEREARSSYERLTGVRVRPVCLESTRFDWLRASIDGLAHDGSSVVEIKCGDRVYWHAASEHRVPQYYFGQLQHILAVTGLPGVDFWCYLPEHPEVHLRVDRDDRYIDRLVEAEMEFWQEVKRQRRM
jgi:putative phage-type endonuclease